MSFVTSGSRMMYAFSPATRAVSRGSRRAHAERLRTVAAIAIAVLAVPLRVPAVLREPTGPSRMRGDLDRDDRPLHRLRDSRSTCVCGSATPGSRASGTSAGTTAGSGHGLRLGRVSSASVHGDRLIRPASPWNRQLQRGCRSTTAPIAVLGTLTLVWGWWLLWARNWFKGPIAQGTRRSSARIEAQYEPGAAPGPATSSA